jgi:hypothetical protein
MQYRLRHHKRLTLFAVLMMVSLAVAWNVHHFSKISVANRLVNSGEILGWDIAQVEHRFGSPTPTDKFAEWGRVYVLGPSSGFGIDFTWLVIRLDDAGRVVEAKVVED